MSDTYAQELFPLGFGHPLWYPQPSGLTGNEKIDIGDVGYIEDGAFVRLFNVTKGAHREKNKVHELPEFRVLPLPDVSTGLYRKLPEEIKSRAVSSHSISVVDGSVNVEGYVYVQDRLAQLP